jgi:hypothetical protein
MAGSIKAAVSIAPRKPFRPFKTVIDFVARVFIRFLSKVSFLCGLSMAGDLSGKLRRSYGVFAPSGIAFPAGFSNNKKALIPPYFMISKEALSLSGAKKKTFTHGRVHTLPLLRERVFHGFRG